MKMRERKGRAAVSLRACPPQILAGERSNLTQSVVPERFSRPPLASLAFGGGSPPKSCGDDIKRRIALPARLPSGGQAGLLACGERGRSATPPRNDKTIKAILFDLGNVLLHYDAKKAACRFSKTCKVPMKRIWEHFFTSPVEKAYTRGEISCAEFYRHAKDSLKIPVDYKTFRRYWNDIFWENDGMDPLLRRLKKKYPLYLISNTNKLHFDHIKKNFKILRHFKKTFPSHEVGCRKPDAVIYRKVLAKIKLRPEETVFIDDMSHFVEGARSVGMHAIRFRNREQLVKALERLGVKV